MDYGGLQWRSWLKHCATSRKVASSIPDGGIGIFHYCRHKWVPGKFRGGWRRPGPRANNLTIFMCRLSWNLGAWNSWNPQDLYRDCFTFCPWIVAYAFLGIFVFFIFFFISLGIGSFTFQDRVTVSYSEFKCPMSLDSKRPVTVSSSPEEQRCQLHLS